MEFLKARDFLQHGTVINVLASNSRLSCVISTSWDDKTSDKREERIVRTERISTQTEGRRG